MTKQIPTKLFLLTGLVIGMGPVSLWASAPLDVRWQDMCTATHDKKLTITTSLGKVVEGYCVNVTANELRVNTRDHGIVQIARGTLGRVFMREGQGGHELRSLHQHLHGALKHELDDLLTEAGPLALAAIPPTLAWGVITAPFCALGDFKHSFDKASEIRVI
jgi:hypothetical protein